MPDIPTLIVGLAAFGAFVSVLAAGLPFVQRDPLSSRLKAVAERRQELSARQRDHLQGRGRRFQPQRHIGIMKAVLDRLNVQALLDDKALRTKLAQAGWRRRNAAVVFVFARVAAPIVMLALVFLYLSTPAFAHWTLAVKLMASLGTAILSAHLPRLLLANAVAKRQKALSRAFPDALDLMVICVEAGVSIEAAFQRVTEEMVSAGPEIAEEIALTSAELAFLSDRRQAYDNLAERTGLPMIKSLCTALVQAERYGTPVATALRVLSQEVRDTRMSLAEKKAAALPAKLTVPMIVFFLPVLFMIVVGPAVIQITQIMGRH